MCDLWIVIRGRQTREGLPRLRAVEADHVILLQRREIAELKARQSPLSDDKLREILWKHLGGDDRYAAIRYAISDIRELAQGMETGTAETLAAPGEA